MLIVEKNMLEERVIPLRETCFMNLSFCSFTNLASISVTLSFSVALKSYMICETVGQLAFLTCMNLGISFICMLHCFDVMWKNFGSVIT